MNDRMQSEENKQVLVLLERRVNLKNIQLSPKSDGTGLAASEWSKGKDEMR